MDIAQVEEVLINEKEVPVEVEKNELYMLHWTIPDEDGMVGASRTSIHLFKTLKGLAEYLLKETFIESVQELRDNFQNDGEENSDVWDVFIIQVED